MAHWYCRTTRNRSVGCCFTQTIEKAVEMGLEGHKEVVSRRVVIEHTSDRIWQCTKLCAEPRVGERRLQLGSSKYCNDAVVVDIRHRRDGDRRIPRRCTIVSMGR